MLIVDSIQKSFGNKMILSDVHLNVARGEIVGVLGRNGTGKSTLLKIIAGCMPADYRYLNIDEAVVQSPRKIASSIGLLPNGFFFPNSIRVNRILSLLPAECRNQLNSFVKDRSIRSSLKFQELSYGQRKLISTLFVLSTPKGYLLLDEPFEGLAPVDCDWLEEVFSNMAPEKGILITDHDYKRVLRVSQKIYLLHAGVLRQINSEDELSRYGYLP